MLTISKQFDVIHFSGYLDEASEFEALENMPENTVKIDFSKVIYTNSIGISALIDYMSHTKKNVEFHNCTDSFLEQLEVVERLMPNNIRIISSQVKVCCSNCGHDEDRTIATKDLKEMVKNLSTQQFKCQNCGKTSEFNPEEELDYSFFANSWKLTPFPKAI